jgi:hypothetical protein
VSERTADALRDGARLLERGSGVEQALELLAERFRWILVAAATAGARDAEDLLEVAQSMRERVTAIAAATDAAFAAHAIALCDATGRNARGSSAPRALYDACLARLSLASRFAAGAAMLARGGTGAIGVGTDSKKAGNPAAPGAVGASPAPRIAERAVETAVEPKPLPAAVAAPTTEKALTAAAPAKDLAKDPAKDPAKDLTELLARLADIAEKSPRDHALSSQIEVLSFTGDAAKVAVRADGSGRYLVTNPDPVRTLLSRAAGRPLRITLEARETPGVAPPPRAASADDAEVRADPLVRRAAELFDASIVAVTRRGAPAETEPNPSSSSISESPTSEADDSTE